MKLITVSLLAAAGILSAGVAQADEALAKKKNCMSCHPVSYTHLTLPTSDLV